MNRNVVLITIGLLVIANAWLAINYEFREGAIYTLLALGALAFFFIFKETKAGQLLLLNFTARGGWIGVLLGAGFVGINVLGSNIAIGIPELQAFTTGARLLTIGFLYPIGEEMFFKFGVFNFVARVLKFGTFAAVLLSSLAFMLYHFFAYGGDLYVNSGLLFGAFLFSVLSFAATRATGTILPAIVAHVIFNAFLVLKQNQVI